ncbi:MAG: DUF86 domain-containing protein [Deltaproteobacteria bacterium]|nr:DUF86 domain-containing protein [Deltaproteobacteria bacterium]
MTRDPRVYLAQIMERIERIKRYTASGKEAFFSDSLIQDAVIRNFEVIGEAAKRIPEQYRCEHPEIPWRGLASFRDVLIHQYEGVSLPEVWVIIERDLPGLHQAITAILPPLDQLERELAGEEEPEDRA